MPDMLDQLLILCLLLTGSGARKLATSDHLIMQPRSSNVSTVGQFALESENV
jgi:hypothetical protein